MQLCNYTDVYYNEEITADLPFMKATASDVQIKKFTLKSGDTIITKDSEDPNDIAGSSLCTTGFGRRSLRLSSGLAKT